MKEISCEICQKLFKVFGKAREAKARFCSSKCRGIWRAAEFVGENHHRYRKEEVRQKNCQHCGKEFSFDGLGTIASFRKRKFCSKECVKAGQKRFYGPEHPRYNPNSRHRSRTAAHAKWSNAVIERDKGICQLCGATGVPLEAHHIKSYSKFPELAYDLDNGMTLCCPCHWQEHATASNENSVNSVEPLTGNAEGNTEPSSNRKVLEGVTTRGRAYRRVETSCEQCGKYINRPLSDVKGRVHVFCGKKCAGLYKAANKIGIHRQRQ